MTRLLGLAAAVLLMSIILLQGFGTEPQSRTERAIHVPVQPRTAATVLPAPNRATINIPRSDYESALARWQAQGVQEYLITLIDSSRKVTGGKMRLRVRLDEGEPHIIEYVRLGQEQPQTIPLSTLPVDDLEYLRSLTVETMFRLIGELFNENVTAPFGPSFDYDVAFDPVMGHPTHIYSRVFSAAGGLSPTECCLSYEVLSLEILERSTPGMPKTGNPGP